LRALVSDETPRTEDVAPLRMPATPGECAELVMPAGTTPGAIGSASRTPLAAARAVTFLLRLVRTVEENVPGADTVAIRRRLYDLRFAVEVVIASRDRLLLAVASTATDSGPETLLRATTATLASLLPPPPADRDDSWPAWAAQLATAVAGAQPPPPSPTDTWPVAPYAALWSAIANCAADLAALDPTIAPGAAIHDWLAATEAVTGSLRPDPLAAPSPMRLAVASAANAGPLERILLGQDLSAHPKLRIDRKLSGNQVSNFGSFLSSRWRLNDWTWGRLDGAQTVVEMVARRDRLVDVTAEQIHDLFIAGADGEWALLLEQRWKVYAELAEADAPAAAQAAIVERIQWDIVREELPLTVQLAKRRNGRDRPPVPAELDVPVATAPPTPAELATFAGVGAESVIDLLRRSDLRQTLLRLGLVGWRALLPGGAAGVAINSALVPTVGTTLYLPLLLALVAPIASIVAGATMWVATSAASGKTGLLEHLPTAIAVVLSCVMYSWQLSASRRARHELLHPPPPGAAATSRRSHWWAVLLTATVSAGLVALVLVMTHSEAANFGGHPALLTGVLSGAAVLLPLIYLGTGTGLLGLVTSGSAYPGTTRSAWLRTLSVLVVAVTTGVATWATVRWCHQHWWTGFLVIYESLALMLVGLLVILSAPASLDEAI
jgi:hypothetical protein